MHRKVAAALVAALALGVASCGESESLTRAELVNRIEAACTAAAERAQTAQGTARGEETFFVGVLAGQRQLLEDVEGLEPPDEAADEIDAIKEGLAARSDALAEVVEAPRAERQRVLAEVGRRVNDVSGQVEEAYRTLGVRECE